MTDIPSIPPDELDGPTLDEARQVAVELVPEPIPDAADLPTDVKDGEGSEDAP